MELKSIHVYATIKTELGCYFPVVKPVYTNEISLSGCMSQVCMSLKGTFFSHFSKHISSSSSGW